MIENPNAISWDSLPSGGIDYSPDVGGLDLAGIESGDASLPVYTNLGDTSGGNASLDSFYGPSDGVEYTSIFSDLMGGDWSGSGSLSLQGLQGGDTSSSKGVMDTLKELFKDNPRIAEVLISGGAGLLKNLGQQEMIKEQREWLEKEDKRKWERQMDARKFGKVAPVKQTGLLDAVQKRMGAKNGTA